jgi:hypothetical protein
LILIAALIAGVVQAASINVYYQGDELYMREELKSSSLHGSP